MKYAGWRAHALHAFSAARAWLRNNRPHIMVVTGEYGIDTLRQLRESRSVNVLWVTRNGPHPPTLRDEGIFEVSAYSHTAILAGAMVALDDDAGKSGAASEVMAACTGSQLRDGRGTILVAEDNPLNQTLIAEQLDAIGWESIVVDDGQQALIALQHGDFDLVLTDIYMPVMDGYELLAAIVAKRPALPVLAFSAVTPSGQAIDWEARGFAGYVAKPASLNELERALRAVRPHVPSDARTAAPPADDSCAIAMPATERERNRALLREHLRTDEPELAGILLRRDIPALRQWAHRSAGAFLIVGADDVVRPCRAVEQRCDDDSEWTSGLHAEATTLLDAVRGYRAGSGQPEVTEANGAGPDSIEIPPTSAVFAIALHGPTGR